MRPRTNDDLCTPPHILNAVRDIGPIILDPCSNPWSSVNAMVAWDGSTVENDGLLNSWVKAAGDGLVFVNPPYGRGHMRKWADKIVAEARRGCEIVALVKGDFSTVWWARLRREASAIAYLTERVAFVGGEHGSGNFASAAFYFGHRPFRFGHSFARLADVRVIR